jgi:class 3 adenylate cyclase
MPTATAQACVLSFDIIGSSKIQHVNAKVFFRNTFTRCNEIISEGYDGKTLRSNAYRIKEMGDGFLCSIGYPFESMSHNLAHAAVDLAKRFAQVLREEARMLHSETPIACGIGIALDTITGFFPEAGTKEYDLYGQAIVLATRYEGMRKTLFEAETARSVLIIQEKVYHSLDPSHRNGFKMMDLKELGIVVRDDPAATRLYYQFLDETQS